MPKGISAETYARYAGSPVPRYTSYPTAPNFTVAEATGYHEALQAVPAGTPASLYVHVPFCRSMCWYCGCHTTVTAREEPVARYLAALERELALVADALPAPLMFKHVHFGGGTPTLMAPEQMAHLVGAIRGRFGFAPSAEIAIEIDPRSLTRNMAAMLGKLGFTRASLGVQSFDPRVQQAINRIQSFEQTAQATAMLRTSGVTAINFDLIYGLPLQSLASCLETVEQALALAPDRFSVFGYAHVPAFKPHQRKIDGAALPGAAARLEQSRAIAEALVAAGYVEIGMDHFARADDAMAKAARERRLHRNFQGYTTDDAEVLIGLGASSIGRLPDGYFQNAVLIPEYERRVAAGIIPVAKGCAISGEDRLRGRIIERLMCDFEVDLADIAADADSLVDRDRLGDLVADGLATRHGSLIRIPDEARPLVRCVAAAFDAHLPKTAGRHAAAV